MYERVYERIYENQQRICDLEMQLRARTGELVELLSRDLDAEAALLLDAGQENEK